MTTTANKHLSDQPDRLVATAERRRRIPVSDMTIWRWEKDGLFPKHIAIGGRNFWRDSDLWSVASGPRPPRPLIPPRLPPDPFNSLQADRKRNPARTQGPAGSEGYIAMSSYTATGSTRKLAVNLTHHQNRPRLDYAVQRIASRARISVAQALVIAELIGLSMGGGHDQALPIL